MKNNLIPALLFGLTVLVSCKDKSESEYNPNNSADTEYFPTEAESDSDNKNYENRSLKDQEVHHSNSEENSDSSNSVKKLKTVGVSGTYIKVGEESDKDCGCYCLEINFKSDSELCLVKDEMYINCRFQKTGDNKVNVFLIGPSTRNKENEVPFENFDTDNPIATIAQLPNGELKMNWLGFKSNDDLITEYAIYGKKTLEGTYKRK